MNFKCKSHRGRSPLNRTDALCIVEVDSEGHISRAFAKVIPNKKAETIISLFLKNVLIGATFFTDEHPSYSSLSSLGYIHKNVCHKYKFVDTETGAHTQNVESFNNCLKCGIKNQMGVKTIRRQLFLNWYCYFLNNQLNFFDAVVDLIKI